MKTQIGFSPFINRLLFITIVWQLTTLFPYALFSTNTCLASALDLLAIEKRAVQLAKELGRAKPKKIDTTLLRQPGASTPMKIKALGPVDPPIRAVLFLQDRPSKEMIHRLQSLGVEIESWHGKWVQVRASGSLLTKIAHWDEINYVRAPLLAKAQEVVSEAVEATGASVLHSAGLSGKGVRIGIIDLGFYNYDLLLGTELPDTVAMKNFRHDTCGFSFCPSQSHGTAVAELIHDIAPDAELYLVSISTTYELLDAINWLEMQDVDIVSCSLGYWLCGPIDGSGWCSVRFGNMRKRGILPVVAAGNSATSHWYGINRDENADSLVEIDNENQSLSFSAYSYGEATVSINWDDWGANPEEAASDQDIDLLVLSPYPYSTEIETVAQGINPQTGEPGHMPIESVSFETEPGRTYYIFLVNTKTTHQVTVHLFLDGDHSYDLVPYEASESVLQPSDSPFVLSVGAANLSGQVLDFSSRGPTWDGRVKPDLTGFSGLETASIPDFSGTSAAAPTVAGVCALLKEAHPEWGPDQVEAALEALANDIFTKGQDEASGIGVVDVTKAIDISDSMQKGFWWNPDRDGTGISIERNGSTDFLTIYSYTELGNTSDPGWVTASSTAFSGMTGPTDLLTWKGWPLGSAPSDFSSQKVAKISLLYLNGDQGILQIKNPYTNQIQRQQIERFYFAGDSIDFQGITGWWWDESQPGNGIFMELQSKVLFCAWYHFREDGMPRWWSFSGDIASLTQGELTADIIEWHGGPCLICPQQEPYPSVVGTATLTFRDGVPVTLTWQATDSTSGTYHLSRFPF